MHAQLAAPRAPNYPGITAIRTAYDTWHVTPSRRRPCASAGGQWSAHLPCPVPRAPHCHPLHTPVSVSRNCLTLARTAPLPAPFCLASCPCRLRCHCAAAAAVAGVPLIYRAVNSVLASPDCPPSCLEVLRADACVVCGFVGATRHDGFACCHCPALHKRMPPWCDTWTPYPGYGKYTIHAYA